MPRDTIRRDRARDLRCATTPAEARLWYHVRGRRFAGFKFRRQHPIGPFFADLACHACKLIVEVDGETHLGRKSRDEARTDYLKAEGWTVLRFWNTQVYDELEAVLEAIYRACVERAARPPHPQPLSPIGMGERGGRQETSPPS